jgi:hypothetical protein
MKSYRSPAKGLTKPLSLRCAANKEMSLRDVTSWRIDFGAYAQIQKEDL